jgi:hypothetical protein
VVAVEAVASAVAAASAAVASAEALVVALVVASAVHRCNPSHLFIIRKISEELRGLFYGTIAVK